MSNYQLSRALCTAVADALSGSHSYLDELFRSAGAPGDPPDFAHHTKWKAWLIRASQNPEVDALKVLGHVLEEILDIKPLAEEGLSEWEEKKVNIFDALEKEGLKYYHGGRLVNIEDPEPTFARAPFQKPLKPSSITDLLDTIVRGLPRAMHPLSDRRKGLAALSFENEYDVQDLLHSLLRPWVADIRAEEFTPSYAGSSTRMDFLLPKHETVIETKIVRDRRHARKIGEELIVDIAHYRVHPKCGTLWCVIYDPNNLVGNPGGLMELEGDHRDSVGSVLVRTVIVTPQ